MVQTTIQESITISETQDSYEIQEALRELLYVPDPRLKPLIIEHYLIYLESRFSSSKIFPSFLDLKSLYMASLEYFPSKIL